MKNINKLPKKAWDQWSEQARQEFNDVYDFICSNQDLIIHPKMMKMRQDHWKTIAWNAAWVAADSMNKINTEVKLWA